jgi:hypothetical protein
MYRFANIWGVCYRVLGVSRFSAFISTRLRLRLLPATEMKKDLILTGSLLNRSYSPGRPMMPEQNHYLRDQNGEA